MANFLQGRDYISINQIKSESQVKDIFKRADQMKQVVEQHQVYEPLKGKAVSVLFYQPSTRTFTSFVAAANRLGAYVVDVHGMTQYSSVTKGETLEDTIRSICQTTAADAIVLRHPDDNSSEVAASVSTIPILNAGSGKAEHPSQALLDLYTIYNHLGRIDNLHVVMVGDMLYGRTVKSLSMLLRLSQNNQVTFVSPKELELPREFVKKLGDQIKIEESDNMSKYLASADVLYMTRVQKEWFEYAGKLEEYEHLKDRFILTNSLANQMPSESIIMHPLPRVGEILQEVDDNPRAQYFDQMRSGLYIRMALLSLILEE